MSEWIKWGGGDCPVPGGTLVDVELRGGGVFNKQIAWGSKDDNPKIDPDGSSIAGIAYWRNDNSSDDIVAYRISE